MYDKEGNLVNRDGELYTYDVAGKQRSVDPTGTNPDVNFEYDGDGKLIRRSEGAVIKNHYFYSTLLDLNLLELNAGGAMEKGYIYSSTKSLLATLKDNKVTFTHEEPAGENIYSVKMDKTVSGRGVLDPLGRTPTMTYPGSICVPPQCYGPAGNVGQYGGGFDGLERLTSWRNEQRYQDSLFWNLAANMRNGVIVTSTMPQGYDPYRDNLNRISHGLAYNVPDGWGNGMGSVERSYSSYNIESISNGFTYNSFALLLGLVGTTIGGGSFEPPSQDKYLSSCVNNAIMQYYKSVGNSSPERLKQVQKALNTLTYSTDGFPYLSPPGLGGENDGVFVARAYTEGSHIYFRDSSHYDPKTAAGMSLIVHEFTHIMQYIEVFAFQEKYIKQWLEHGTGPANSYERKAYTNGTISEKFFNNNPKLLCP